LAGRDIPALTKHLFSCFEKACDGYPSWAFFIVGAIDDDRRKNGCCAHTALRDPLNRVRVELLTGQQFNSDPI
jgi:hypothetical protein